MDAMLKAYKYRLYPNKKQEAYFAKTYGCVRVIYNKMLSDKIDYYKENLNKYVNYVLNNSNDNILKDRIKQEKVI